MAKSLAILMTSTTKGQQHETQTNHTIRNYPGLPYGNRYHGAVLGYGNLYAVHVGERHMKKPLEYYQAEADYIKSINPKSPGDCFNNDPACFARYIAMQANAMDKAGHPLLVSEIDNAMFAADKATFRAWKAQRKY